MTEEKLKLKCVTGGEHHRSSLTFHFEFDDLRAIKYFLGFGFLDINKLDSEMNRFHSKKVVEATDGLEKGRLNSKRRQTISRQNDIFDILKRFESLTQTEKISSLQFHLLEIGTLTKKTLSPEYFDCLPPLTDIETEQTEPPICINFSSFLDETNPNSLV